MKQQFDQELQHFSQSLQALNIARGKFKECLEDVKSLAKPENDNNKLLVPLSGSLYVRGSVRDNTKFMVDIGTGYYVEKDTEQALNFYEKKIAKLNRESIQIQDIIKEKSHSSLAIEGHLRHAAIRRHEELAKQNPQ